MQFSMHSNHYNIGPRPVVIAEFMFENSKLQTVILNDLAWCLNATSPYDFYTWFRIVGRYIVAYSAHYKSTVAYRQFYSLDDIDRLQRQHMVKKLEKEIEEITSGEALESRVRKLLMIKR
jgi:lysine/ornithine N-monooxygenase